MALSNPTLPEITDGYEIQLHHSMGHDHLQDLIERTIGSGFSREEVLIAISELAAEDFAAATKIPSVH
ncbi:hypothetical protein PH547_27600 [Rhizobium sp. CNPSo 3464]|nr:hypothetical protein [Rhizobium sp. CNPSo 3464]MDK4742659.1 hypothetical protein [Rhizobium sp. CNPSo 3464]